MRLAIVMPVVLQNERILSMTLDAIAHLKTVHEATLYIVCNRLHVCTPETLYTKAKRRFSGEVKVVHEAGVERSVAGAWNKGCQLAVDAGNDFIAIVANDTQLRHDCLDQLVEYGKSHEADLWSGISYNNRDEIDASAQTDGADFSCFMTRPSTLSQFGMFDPNFRPAYFEDNDYYARVVLGGGRCRVVHAAQFFHHGSMTIKEDTEMAQQVSLWFEKNRQYFARKWGVQVPENSAEGVISRYYRHPFNNESKALSWFPGEPY